jgi:hypothetical protein
MAKPVSGFDPPLRTIRPPLESIDPVVFTVEGLKVEPSKINPTPLASESDWKVMSPPWVLMVSPSSTWMSPVALRVRSLFTVEETIEASTKILAAETTKSDNAILATMSDAFIETVLPVKVITPEE